MLTYTLCMLNVLWKLVTPYSSEMLIYQAQHVLAGTMHTITVNLPYTRTA